MEDIKKAIDKINGYFYLITIQLCMREMEIINEFYFPEVK